jgi:catechol 2,3-dioxygenase-like lactoylglutathione lyase family enzyme
MSQAADVAGSPKSPTTSGVPPEEAEAMPIKRLDHVQLAMPPGREEEVRAFYGGILGISEVPKPPHLAKRGGCWFETDALKIHLGVETDFKPARKAHPALIVSDLGELVARLETRGYRVVEDEPLEGYNRRYVADPFGNRIELMEPDKSVSDDHAANFVRRSF